MKQSRPLLLSRPFVIASLIAGFALALTTALLVTVSTRELADAGRRVYDTQATLREINRLLALVVDTETGQRGYILTGMEDYLAPYHRASAQLDTQLSALRGRFATSPERLAILDRIGDLLLAKRAEMGRTIELRRADAIAPALHIVDSGVGMKTMDALRDAVRQLELAELDSLSARTAAAGRRASFFQIAGLAMFIAACVLAGTVARLLVRRMRELETMITVCAWTRRVKFDGKWVSFEEYLRARFDLRFTHGISEEASKKLRMDALEFVEHAKPKGPGPRRPAAP